MIIIIIIIITTIIIIIIIIIIIMIIIIIIYNIQANYYHETFSNFSILFILNSFSKSNPTAPQFLLTCSY